MHCAMIELMMITKTPDAQTPNLVVSLRRRSRYFVVCLFVGDVESVDDEAEMKRCESIADASKRTTQVDERRRISRQLTTTTTKTNANDEP